VERTMNNRVVIFGLLAASIANVVCLYAFL
jgi:hypothetical protein